MKRIAVIFVAIPPETREHWERVISTFVKNPKWTEPLNREKGKTSIYCRIDTQDSKYESFLTVLNDRGLRYPDYENTTDYKNRFESVLHSKGVTWMIGRIEHVYSDAELREFPYLDVRVRRAEIAPFGPSHGTTYDLATGCPQCGCGAVQTSPFYAPPSAFPKSGLICASSTEMFVAASLAEALRRGGVSGVELRQVQDHRSREPLPWNQVISTFEMPRMDATSKGVIQSEDAITLSCAKCRRDCHFDTRTEPCQPVYRRRELPLATLPDVAHTWERYGKSGIHLDDFRHSRFASPLILVNRKVFDIFRDLKVKHAVFNPVRFI